MVELTRGSAVPDVPNYIIKADDGKYADFDLITCGPAMDDTADALYQAQYLKYGPLVYQFNTPEELGAAIYAIDPESAHDAAQIYREDLARKQARANGTLTPENPAPAPDAIDPTEPLEPPPAPDAEEPVLEEFEPLESGTIPEEVPEVPTEVVDEVPVISSEPELPAEATTTPPGIEAASSTPAIDLSTTTPE